MLERFKSYRRNVAVLKALGHETARSQNIGDDLATQSQNIDGLVILAAFGGVNMSRLDKKIKHRTAKPTRRSYRLVNEAISAFQSTTDAEKIDTEMSAIVPQESITTQTSIEPADSKGLELNESYLEKYVDTGRH